MFWKYKGSIVTITLGCFSSFQYLNLSLETMLIDQKAQEICLYPASSKG